MAELSVKRFCLCPIIRFANLNVKQFTGLGNCMSCWIFSCRAALQCISSCLLLLSSFLTDLDFVLTSSLELLSWFPHHESNEHLALVFSKLKEDLTTVVWVKCLYLFSLSGVIWPKMLDVIYSSRHLVTTRKCQLEDDAEDGGKGNQRESGPNIIEPLSTCPLPNFWTWCFVRWKIPFLFNFVWGWLSFT